MRTQGRGSSYYRAKPSTESFIITRFCANGRKRLMTGLKYVSDYTFGIIDPLGARGHGQRVIHRSDLIKNNFLHMRSHTCARYFDQPSNLRTMGFTLQLGFSEGRFLGPPGPAEETTHQGRPTETINNSTLYICIACSLHYHNVFVIETLCLNSV